MFILVEILFQIQDKNIIFFPIPLQSYVVPTSYVYSNRPSQDLHLIKLCTLSSSVPVPLCLTCPVHLIKRISSFKTCQPGKESIQKNSDSQAKKEVVKDLEDILNHLKHDFDKISREECLLIIWHAKLDWLFIYFKFVKRTE